MRNRGRHGRPGAAPAEWRWAHRGLVGAWLLTQGATTSQRNLVTSRPMELSVAVNSWDHVWTPEGLRMPSTSGLVSTTNTYQWRRGHTEANTIVWVGKIHEAPTGPYG